jgi:osmoprotectant transport system ATP-binding protein
MLMDEPFGAIDPINRERLQNEFLRLQARLRKTVVFVTHDIDEAIKMGDRIAVMKVGGVLAQYATPAELLVSPADAFVEDFVGADRALKRLALLRVRDLDLWAAPLVREGESTAAARVRANESEVPYPLLVDPDGKPLGWLSERDLSRSQTISGPADSAPVPLIDRDDVLRDALSALLQNGSQYAPVVDARGVAVGVLSVEIVSLLLAEGSTAEESPSERAGSVER